MTIKAYVLCKDSQKGLLQRQRQHFPGPDKALPAFSRSKNKAFHPRTEQSAPAGAWIGPAQQTGSLHHSAQLIVQSLQKTIAHRSDNKLDDRFNTGKIIF